MYAKIEPSGCGEHHGNVKIRLDFYLDPTDVRYEERHTLVPVIPPEGYPGKVDEEGIPINQADYDTWLVSLPHIWQLAPFHSHFIYADPDVTDAEIQKIANFHLVNFYQAWCQEKDHKPGGMREGWYRGLLDADANPIKQGDYNNFLEGQPQPLNYPVRPLRYEELDESHVFSLRKTQCEQKAESIKLSSLDVRSIK